MRALILVAALGAGAGVAFAASSGCVACDEGICTSTLWIYFDEPEGGALEDGTYQIDIVVDGEPDAATCTIADQAHSLDCEGLAYTLYAPLYDSAENPHTVLELYFEDDDPPDEVEVRITHDGAVVFDETITPEYELADPKCDDDCLRSMNRFELER
jgi:hypothetical protein